MIVSASYRSDIPAFYGRWFLRRLDAGFAEVRNPYGGPPYRVSLATADVDGFVFWTRNAAPFRQGLAAVQRRGLPFVVQYTVTGSPRALEAAVPPATHAVEEMRRIAGRYGPDTVVWRYDPIVDSSLTPQAHHRETFARLAEALAGTVDEVVISFAAIYRKTARNMDTAARQAGFAWFDPPAEAKRALAGELSVIAAAHGMQLTVCAQPDLVPDGASPARCIDADRLARVAGRPLRARQRGNRPGCLCAESRDIGAYDTCPHGCAYCYAVGSPATARQAVRDHDPATPMLAPPRARPASPAQPASPALEEIAACAPASPLPR